MLSDTTASRSITFWVIADRIKKSVLPWSTSHNTYDRGRFTIIFSSSSSLLTVLRSHLRLLLSQRTSNSIAILFCSIIIDWFTVNFSLKEQFFTITRNTWSFIWASLDQELPNYNLFNLFFFRNNCRGLFHLLPAFVFAFCLFRQRLHLIFFITSLPIFRLIIGSLLLHDRCRHIISSWLFCRLFVFRPLVCGSLSPPRFVFRRPELTISCGLSWRERSLDPRSNLPCLSDGFPSSYRLSVLFSALDDHWSFCFTIFCRTVISVFLSTVPVPFSTPMLLCLLLRLFRWSVV